MSVKHESEGIARIRGHALNPVNSHGQEPLEQVPSDDSWESPSGDGRNSRHSTLSCQLIKGKQIIGIIRYPFEWAEGDYNGTVFKVQFFRGEALIEVVIEGAVGGLQQIVDRVTAGKRESIRVNGESVTDIRIREVPPPPKKG